MYKTRVIGFTSTKLDLFSLAHQRRYTTSLQKLEENKLTFNCVQFTATAIINFELNNPPFNKRKKKKLKTFKLNLLLFIAM